MGNETKITGDSSDKILKDFEKMGWDSKTPVTEQFNLWMKNIPAFVEKGWESEFAKSMAVGYPGEDPKSFDQQKLLDLEKRWKIEQKLLIEEKMVNQGQNVDVSLKSGTAKVASVVEKQVKQEGKYKGIPEAEYIQKKVDYVTKLEGMDEATKKKVLESMKTMPIENLNGFAYGLEQNLKAVKDKKLTAEQLGKNVDLGIKVCGRDYTDYFSGIKNKLGEDFVNKNSKLFEVGFMGMDVSEDELVKLVEEAGKAKNLGKVDQYYIVKNLMNVHGVEPVKLEKPKVVSVSMVSSNPSNSTDKNDGQGAPGNNSYYESGGEKKSASLGKEMTDDQKSVVDKWAFLTDEQKEYVRDYVARSKGEYPGINEVPSQSEIAQKAEINAKIAVENAKLLELEAIKAGNKFESGAVKLEVATKAKEAADEAQKKAEGLQQKAIQEGNKVMSGEKLAEEKNVDKAVKNESVVIKQKVDNKVSSDSMKNSTSDVKISIKDVQEGNYVYNGETGKFEKKSENQDAIVFNNKTGKFEVVKVKSGIAGN